MVKKYKPLLYTVLGEGFDMYKDLVSNDEWFKKKALSRKKTLDAYIAHGFTREEALLFMVESDIGRVKMLSSISGSATKATKNKS